MFATEAVLRDRTCNVCRTKWTIAGKPYSEYAYPSECGSRQTSWYHSYALSELQKDVKAELLLHPESERERLWAATKFAIFVVHNKMKAKLAELPLGTPWVAFGAPPSRFFQ